jgi:hypothetical protein
LHPLGDVPNFRSYRIAFLLSDQTFLVAPPVPPLTPREAPPPVPDVGSRYLFGFGLHMGVSNDEFTQGSNGGGGVGIYVRLGVQLNDRWGIEGEFSAATVIVDSYVRGAMTVDFTPVDWFTLALGPFAREDWDVVSCGCGDTTVAIQSVGGTVRFDFHPAFSRTASGRNAFTIGLVGDLGATVGASGFCDEGGFTGSGPSEAVYLTFGYTHY